MQGNAPDSGACPHEHAGIDGIVHCMMHSDTAGQDLAQNRGTEALQVSYSIEPLSGQQVAGGCLYG